MYIYTYRDTHSLAGGRVYIGQWAHGLGVGLFTDCPMPYPPPLTPQVKISQFCRHDNGRKKGPGMGCNVTVCTSFISTPGVVVNVLI